MSSKEHQKVNRKKQGSSNIKLTEHQQAVLAEFADSEAFSIIRTVLMKQRREQIMEAALNSPNIEELRGHQGRAAEQDEFLRRIIANKKKFDNPEG